jgi:hypothetical protein
VGGRVPLRSALHLLLVPSPLLGPATWAPVAGCLELAGRSVSVVDLPLRRTVDDVVGAVVAAAGDGPVVLVPHSNAGLYAPRLGELLDVAATVHVDSALPGDGPDTALAPAGFLDFLRGLEGADGLLPPWTQWWDDVADLFPDDATRAAVEAEQQRLPLSYFTGRVPVPPGWQSRTSAYVAFGDTYAEERDLATAAGWPTRTLAGGHLHQLHDPAAVGRALVDLSGS